MRLYEKVYAKPRGRGHYPSEGPDEPHRRWDHADAQTRIRGARTRDLFTSDGRRVDRHRGGDTEECSQRCCSLARVVAVVPASRPGDVRDRRAHDRRRETKAHVSEPGEKAPVR